MPPIIACWRATSPPCAPSRRRRCRRWMAMRCAPPMPRSVERAAESDRRGRGRPAVRPHGRRRRGGADLYRRRDPRRRRRRRDPGRHGRRRRHITITEAATPGRHVRPAGVDFREGDVLLTGGKPPHRPRPLAGRRHELSGTAVRRRPKVALLATGDELVMPGSTPGPGQIVYSNGYALRALARAEGAETIDLGIAADTVEATTAGIRRARDARRRYPGHDRRRLGRRPRPGQAARWRPKASTMAFWKIAMRPGKPMMHGRLGADAGDRPARQSRVLLCLRLAVLVPLDSRFVRPQGRPSRRARPPCSAAMSPPTTCARTICARAWRQRADGALIATPVNQQDSSLLAKSRCGTGASDPSRRLRPAARAGSSCEILRLPE